MNLPAILVSTRPKRRSTRLRRAAGRGPLKRRGRPSSGLERRLARFERLLARFERLLARFERLLALERLLARLIGALRKRGALWERAGGSKAAAQGERERAEVPAPALVAAARKVWSDRPSVTSMARRHGRVHRSASRSGARAPATSNRVRRRARALVGTGVGRLTTRGR